MNALTPDQMIRALAVGMFPMAPSRSSEAVDWIEPKLRAIIPMDGFKLSRSLKQRLRSDSFIVTVDQAFALVVERCAEITSSRIDTWISPSIEAVCIELHNRGVAHSVECWKKGALVGGIFGVGIGAFYSMESMFSREPDASKVALAYTLARLRVGGYRLADCQLMTQHLASLGAIQIDQKAYRRLLNEALEADGLSAAMPLRAQLSSTVDFFALDKMYGATGEAGRENLVPGRIIEGILAPSAARQC